MTAEQEMIYLQQQERVNAKENYNKTFYREIPVLVGTKHYKSGKQSKFSTGS